MAYPAGVITRSVAFSDIIDSEDATELASKTRIIVSCNGTLVHTATGKQLLPTPQIFVAAVLLPVTDQVGVWTDTKGKALTSPTHSYNIDMEYKTVLGDWITARSWPKLLLPTSGGALDLDTYFDNLKTNYTTG